MLLVHDEATLRMKSFLPAEHLPANPRGRFSKVQNICAHVSVNDQPMQPWLAHLQPLHLKDGPSIAESLRKVIDVIIDIMTSAANTATSSRKAHLTLVAVGDGIPTNENALKRIVNHYRSARKLPLVFQGAQGDAFSPNPRQTVTDESMKALKSQEVIVTKLS